MCRQFCSSSFLFTSNTIKISCHFYKKEIIEFQNMVVTMAYSCYRIPAALATMESSMEALADEVGPTPCLQLVPSVSTDIFVCFFFNRKLNISILILIVSFLRCHVEKLYYYSSVICNHLQFYSFFCTLFHLSSHRP